MRDTRDKIGKHDNVDNYLVEQGHKVVRSKMFVGDVTLLQNQSVCIDLKRDLQEVVGNVAQQHKRFSDECERAKQAGIQLYILIEHGNGIKSIEDVKTWENPRLKVSPYCISGPKLHKIMLTYCEKYGVEWFFCERHQTGEYVENLLLQTRMF